METAETSIGTVRLCNAAHGAVDVIVRPEELVLIDGTDSLITRVDYLGMTRFMKLRRLLVLIFGADEEVPLLIK